MPFCYHYDKCVLFFPKFSEKVIPCKRKIKLIRELWLIEVYKVEAEVVNRRGVMFCLGITEGKQLELQRTGINEA